MMNAPPSDHGAKSEVQNLPIFFSIAHNPAVFYVCMWLFVILRHMMISRGTRVGMELELEEMAGVGSGARAEV